MLVLGHTSTWLHCDVRKGAPDLGGTRLAEYENVNMPLARSWCDHVRSLICWPDPNIWLIESSAVMSGTSWMFQDRLMFLKADRGGGGPPTGAPTAEVQTLRRGGGGPPTGVEDTRLNVVPPCELHAPLPYSRSML